AGWSVTRLIGLRFILEGLGIAGLLGRPEDRRLPLLDARYVLSGGWAEPREEPDEEPGKQRGEGRNKGRKKRARAKNTCYHGQNLGMYPSIQRLLLSSQALVKILSG